MHMRYMKLINRYINEKLKLSNQSKLKNKDDEIIEYAINDFCHCHPFKDEIAVNNNFLIVVKRYITEYIKKYNYDLEDFKKKFLWDGPDPLDDYDVDWDYKSKKDGSYYEFIIGPQILGFICDNINYYYRFSKK